MVKRKEKRDITRKAFLKKSSFGVIGAGFLARRSVSFMGWNAGPGKRVLGRTGIEITTLGFGASRTQQPAVLLAALDNGINFLDTGRSYANGQNEEMIGRTIKGIRQDIIIQSKVKIRPSETGNALNTKEAGRKIRDIMQKSLDESLKALQSDYIDIWLIHGAESEEIIHHQAVMDFFTELKSKGIIRASGFSSHYNQAGLLKADSRINFYDVAMLSYTFAGSYTHSVTGRHSSYDQNALEEEMRSANRSGKGIIAMKTCSAGPYQGEDHQEPSFGNAIQWVLDQPFVHSAAVAMANFSQIDENTRAIFG